MSGNSNSKLGIIAGVIATIYYSWAVMEKILKINIIDFPFEWVTGGFLLVSLILLILTIIKWPSTETNSWIFLRKKYLIGLIVFTCSLLFLFGTQVNFFNKKDKIFNEREKIVVLLPIDKTKADQPAYQDGKRQAYGYIDLIEKNPEILKKYDIVFRNHGMDETNAVEIVSDELKNGTNYFISTMSHISERLSKDFKTLIEKNKQNELDKPKLIVTVSSSSKIQVKANSVYRFYIRSNEESLLFSNYAYKNGVNERLVAIVVNDNYGNRAKEVFNSNYGKPFNVQILLDKKLGKEIIKTKIKESVAANGINNTFFIVHYGNGLDNIISSISELGLPGNFIISHPITVDEWFEPVEEILNYREWITCYPEAEDGGIYVSDDIIRDFVYFSIHRLIKTLDETSISNSDFDSAWKKSDEPQRIKYRINSEGDSEIKLRLVKH